MTDEIRYPRVFDENLTFLGIVNPVKLSLTLSIVPLSYASMQLPRGKSLPARGYVELYTSMGSAGFFRVRSPQESYGEDITTSELEHAIVEVGDYLVLNDYNEMMAATTAMQTVFSHYRGNKWQLGSVSALGTDQIALQADHNRVLEAMIAILDQKPDCMMTFDFSTSPWTVAIAKRGTVVQAEGRLSRNVNSAKVAYDDTELCTRCYYEYPTSVEGQEPSSAWAYVDTDTMSQYGLVERTAPVNGAYSQSESRSAAVAYAEKHKNPRVSVSISAEELSSITGEAFDTFTIGKLFRLALLDYNVTIEQVITGLSWSDVFDAPEDVTVSLEDEEDTTVTFLHDLDAKGGAGGGGGGAKKQEVLWKEYYTHFDKTDYYIDMWARHVDTTDRILQQAGMYLDSNGVLIYATDYENNVGSKIKVNADAIALKVSKGDVATQLAVECGNVTITGGNLVVDGYVTANELEILEDAWADSFTSKSLSSDTATLGVVDVDEINGVIGPQSINISVDGVLKATVLGSGDDVNFDRAAAQREGANSVYISPSDIKKTDSDYALNGGAPYYDVAVEATAISRKFADWFSETTEQVIRVPATDAYNDGITEGESHFEAVNVNLRGTKTVVYKRGTKTTVNLLGTKTVIYKRGTKTTGTNLGTKRENACYGYTNYASGLSRELFRKSGDDYVSVGNHIWRYGGTVKNLYEAGSDYTLYTNGGSVEYYADGGTADYYTDGGSAEYYADGGTATYYRKKTT